MHSFMVSLAYTKKIDGKLLFKMISRQGRLRNNASHSGKRETAGCQTIDRGLSSQRPVNCVYFLFRDRKNIFCELNIMRAWRFNTNVSSVVTVLFSFHGDNIPVFVLGRNEYCLC